METTGYKPGNPVLPRARKIQKKMEDYKKEKG